MQSAQLGFNPLQLLTVRIELPFTRYDELNKTLNFTTRLLEEVRPCVFDPFPSSLPTCWPRH